MHELSFLSQLSHRYCAICASAGNSCGYTTLRTDLFIEYDTLITAVSRYTERENTDVDTTDAEPAAKRKEPERRSVGEVADGPWMLEKSGRRSDESAF